MFWIKNKKKIGIPLHTLVFFYIKLGFKGIFNAWARLRDERECGDLVTSGGVSDSRALSSL